MKDSCRPMNRQKTGRGRYARHYTAFVVWLVCVLMVVGCAYGIGIAPLEKHGDKDYTAGPVPVEWVSTNAVLRAITPTQMVMNATYILRNDGSEDQTIIMGVPKAPYKGQSLGEPVISIDGAKAEFRTVKMNESPDGSEGEDKYITWYTFSFPIKAGETKGFDISYIIVPNIEENGTYTAKLPLMLNRFWDRAPQSFSLTIMLPYPYSLDPTPSVLPVSRREDGAYVWSLPANSSPDFILSVKDTGVTMQRFFAQANDDQAKAIYNAYTSRNITKAQQLAEEYLTASPELPHVKEVRVLLAMISWLMDDKEQALVTYDMLQDGVGFGDSGTFVANKILFDRYNYLLATDQPAASYLLQTQPFNENPFFEAWIRANAAGPQITPSPEPTAVPDIAPTVVPAGTPQPTKGTDTGSWKLSTTTTVVLFIILGLIVLAGGFFFVRSRMGTPAKRTRNKRRRY